MMKACLIFLLILPTLTYAKNKDGVSVGLGHIFSKSEYAGVSSKHIPMPYFSFTKGNFSLYGLNAKYTFFKQKNLTVSALLNPKFFAGGYEAEDSTELQGMEERKGTVEFGLSSTLKVKKVTFDLKVLRDILGVHDGLTASFGVGSKFPISVIFKSLPFTLFGLSTGIKFYDSNYVDYYYGVKANEVTSARAAYSGESVINPFLSSFLLVKLSEKWSLTNINSLEFLSNKIKASPIVSRSKKLSLITFLVYKI